MRRWLLVLLACFFAFMTACGETEDVSSLAERAARSGILPVGAWYSGEAEAWEEGYLPEALRAVFLGEEGSVGLSYRLFLGRGEARPSEVLIAVCDTQDRAIRLAEHLAARLAYLQELGEDAYAPALTQAAVRRKGRTVVYVAVEDGEAVLSYIL